MGIESIPHKSGAGRAKIICDDCGKEDCVPCAYIGKNIKGEPARPNESQARAKALNMGWSYVKNKLRCPTCEAKRKVKKEPEQMPEKKTNVAPIRRPDGLQRRLIVLALVDAYDDQAKRYHGDATDKTVAADLGGGVMPGWVAEIREDMFGPAGNEEVDNLRSDIEALARETKQQIETFAAEQQKKIDALAKRLDGVVAAHDKRVG